MELNTLKESIKKYEGLKLKPYLCPSKRLTIGYGRNIQDVGISKNEAEVLLNNDLLEIKLKLEDKIKLFYKLDDVRQNVLIEMAYNMGVSNLLNFKKTIGYLESAVFCLNKSDIGSAKTCFQYASIEMLNSKWHRDFLEYDLIDGKQNNHGLLRSEYLAKVMREGKY